MNIVESYKKALNWIGCDGALHFLVSALDVLIFALFLHVWGSVLLVLGIGLGKEVFDLIRHGVKGYDWKNSGHDLICDLAGIILGASIASAYLYVL